MRQVTDYLNLLAGEHRGKPKFEATVELLTAPMAALQEFLAMLPAAFDLDVAVGVQLDIDGIWIGRSRQIQVPVPDVFFSFDIPNLGWDQGVWFGPYTQAEGLSSFDDETYRALLRAKIICNSWDGTVTQMQAALQTILNPYPTVLGIVDNYNMTMDIGLVGPMPPRLIFYLVTGDYVPFKPEGVALNTYVTSITSAPLFGLDVETNFISGLDVGAWGVAPSTVVLLPTMTTNNLVNVAGSGSITVSAITYELGSVAIAVAGNAVASTGGGALQQGTVLTAGAGNVGGVATTRNLALATVSGVGQTAVHAGQFASAILSGLGGIAVNVTIAPHIPQAVIAMIGSGHAAVAVTESPSGTQSIQPGQLILASQTPGSAAPVNGPFDTWEISAAKQVVHNGVADTTTSGAISVYYLNHTIYHTAVNGTSFGTPGWYSWNGTTWVAVASPIGESVEGTFAVFTIASGPGGSAPAQTALNSITLSGTGFTANTAAAAVGTITVNTTPAGAFSPNGVLTHSNTTQFTINGSTLQTAVGLAAGTYSDTITATLAGANPTSISTIFASLTAVGSGTSANGTTIPPAASIIDASGNTWTLSNGAQVLENGNLVGTYGSSGVILVLWYNSTIYQENNTNNWYSWSGTDWTGPVSDPRPA